MGLFDYFKNLSNLKVIWGEKELNKKAIDFLQDQRNQIIPIENVINLNKDGVQKNFTEFIDNGYASGTDVKPVVDKISTTAGSVPWVVKEVMRNGDIEIVENSGLNDLLVMPSPGIPWVDFMQSAIINLMTTGNTFIEPLEAVGFGELAKQLEILAPQAMTPIINHVTGFVKGYRYKVGNIERTFTVEELIHTKYYNPRLKGYTTGLGLSPLEAAVYAYQTSNSQWLAASSMLKNKGVIGFISNDSDIILDKSERKEAQDALNRDIGGPDKFGGVRVTPSKMRYQAMGMTAGDMKMIEMGVVSLRAICNIYGVDSSLFNDPANKTFNNRKEAEKALWTNVNIPTLEKFKSTYNQSFVKAYSESEGRNLFVDYDVSEVQVLHEDKDKQATRGVKLNNAITNTAKMVASGEISHEGAINILVYSFGMSEEQAGNIINSVEINNNGEE